MLIQIIISIMQKTNNYHFYYIYPLMFSLVLALVIPAFVFCVIAEFKKSKVEDVKLDGILCELEGSEAFGFGIAALLCFTIAQIVGNLIVFVACCSARKTNCQAKLTIIPSLLFAISWISFGVSFTLISTSTSMNRRQTYGKGWLDGECYLVKDGVFIGASILVLLSLGCTLASAMTTLRRNIHVSTNEKKPTNGALSIGIK